MLITFCQLIFKDLHQITMTALIITITRTMLRLPMTRKEYYVQCIKYQFLKLIRKTSQFKY